MTLGTDEMDVINATYKVLVGDPDPLPNTASVSCTFDGGTQVVASASDGHSVDLFQPAVSIVKKAGGRFALIHCGIMF